MEFTKVIPVLVHQPESNLGLWDNNCFVASLPQLLGAGLKSSDQRTKRLRRLSRRRR